MKKILLIIVLMIFKILLVGSAFFGVIYLFAKFMQTNYSSVDYSVCVVTESRKSLCRYSFHSNNDISFRDDILLHGDEFYINDKFDEVKFNLTMDALRGSDSLEINLDQVIVVYDNQKYYADEFFPYNVAKDGDREFEFEFHVQQIRKNFNENLSDNIVVYLNWLNDEEFTIKKQELEDEKQEQEELQKKENELVFENEIGNEIIYEKRPEKIKSNKMLYFQLNSPYTHPIYKEAMEKGWTNEELASEIRKLY
jgi:hypothetical protein